MVVLINDIALSEKWVITCVMGHWSKHLLDLFSLCSLPFVTETLGSETLVLNVVIGYKFL